jgi:hypothetical protein
MSRPNIYIEPDYDDMQFPWLVTSDHEGLLAMSIEDRFRNRRDAVEYAISFLGIAYEAGIRGGKVYRRMPA